MHRRELLRLAASAAAAGSAPRWSWSATVAQRDLFALGVASGSPTPEGIVLWTRLLDGPAPGAPTGIAREPLPSEVTVRWEVAYDEGFRRIVRAGHATALAALGHSVHVEVDGLSPGRWYFYRFLHGDAVSRTARTRTAPAPDEMPARMRLAFASCQRWEQGHFAAWRHAAGDDLDLVLFLGDYVYEYAVPQGAPRQPLARTHTLAAATTLDDWRDRYALYRSDAHLRAAHHACPWLITWDDHEVQNDYAGATGTGEDGAFLRQRAAGYQAFYENMPLRAGTLRQQLAGPAGFDALQVHGRTAWGRLLRLHVLDTRQYRDRQACRAPGAASGGATSPGACAALAGDTRTMLGAAQENWVREGLAQDAAAGTRWSAVGQQTLLSRRNLQAAPDERLSTDTWDGYPAARQRLLDAVRETAPRNTVFLGGDLHQNYVCRVHADFSQGASPVIASEFCGTSISSASATTPQQALQVVRNNPHMLLARPEQRGYGLAEITPTRWTTTLRVVDDAARADSAAADQARFVVEDRVAGPQPG